MGTKRDAESPKMGDDNKRPALDLPIPKETADTKFGEKLQSEIDKICNELMDGIGSLTSKMGELYFTNQQTVASLNYQGSNIGGINEDIADLKDQLDEKDEEIRDLRGQLREALSKIEEAQKDIGEVKTDIRNKNMVINGLPEVNNENCKLTVLKFLKNIDPSMKPEHIETHIESDSRLKVKTANLKDQLW